MAFASFKPNSFFVANRNFVSNKHNSKGKLVAYVHKKIASRTADATSIENEMWYLGCVVCMTLSRSDIAKMVIGPGGCATITGNVGTFDHVRDVFTVHHLNWASNMDMTGASGYIIASGLGLSVRKFNAAEYKLIGGARLPDSEEIKPVVCETIHTGCSYFSPLLQSMNANKVNLKTFRTVGMHIVVLSAPLKSLSIMNGDRRFLCPLLTAQRVSASSAYLQDYV